MQHIRAELWVLLSCIPVLAVAFDQIVAFGDSLTDNGGEHGVQAIVRRTINDSSVVRLALSSSTLRLVLCLESTRCLLLSVQPT